MWARSVVQWHCTRRCHWIRSHKVYPWRRHHSLKWYKEWRICRRRRICGRPATTRTPAIPLAKLKPHILNLGPSVFIKSPWFMNTDESKVRTWGPFSEQTKLFNVQRPQRLVSFTEQAHSGLHNRRFFWNEKPQNRRSPQAHQRTQHRSRTKLETNTMFRHSLIITVALTRTFLRYA